MSDPLVCCVMLTRDRPAMAAKAVECFRAQTYERKMLYMLQTGEDSEHIWDLETHDDSTHEGRVIASWFPDGKNKSIGHLRNVANIQTDVTGLGECADLVAHWDDDDYSHPLRLEQQVSALMASDADCVGYRSALFYKMPLMIDPVLNVWASGEAYRYRCLTPQFVVGASMLYRREAWKRRLFEDIHRGEDTRWQMGVKVLPLEGAGDADKLEEPMMICRIHAGSTSTGTPGRGPDWVRVKEYDEYCRRRMQL